MKEELQQQASRFAKEIEALQGSHAEQLKVSECEHSQQIIKLQASWEQENTALLKSHNEEIQELKRRGEEEKAGWNGEATRMKERLEKQLSDLKAANANLVQDKQRDCNTLQKQLSDKEKALNVLTEQVLLPTSWLE